MTSRSAATAGQSPARSGTACAALAALVYLGCALYALWPALGASRHLLPYSPALGGPLSGRMAQLIQRDQKMVVSVVTRNAAILTTRPWELFGDGQCYPMPRGYTLGEHMFGLGFLAAIPWALTHDPISSFNVALVLTLLLPALSMYALSLYFTRSPPAAFVAGLLFALLPKRLADPAHPYIHGDLWTPLALLFLHRLLTRGGWANAFSLTLFTILTLCESLYPLAGLAILLAIFGSYLLVRHRSRLPALLPQLAFVTLTVLTAAWLVFAPYQQTRSTWGLLSGRKPLLPALSVYLPGALGFPGAVTCTLIALALLDRLRGPRRVGGDDPRLAFLAGGIAIVMLTIAAWEIPWLGIRIPSPLLLARMVPGLDAVRGLPSIGISAGLPFAFVAGYGVRALTERMRPPATIAIVAVIFLLVVASRFHPLLARPLFGVDSLATTAFEARPPEDEIALYRKAGKGALLDVPFSWEGTKRLGMAEDLLRVSYTPRSTAACYNSFVSPVQRQISELAGALPDERAADALVSLGFGTVMLEKPQLLAVQMLAFRTALRAQQQEPHPQRLVEVGQTKNLIAYELSSPAAIRSDFALLAREAAGDPATAAEDAAIEGPTGAVAFSFHNAGDATFRHPDPLIPSDLVVRWSDAIGATAHEQRLRALLPIALGAGASMEVPLVLQAPATAGTYTVEIARAAAPDTVLARRRVRVGSGVAGHAPRGGAPQSR